MVTKGSTRARLTDVAALAGVSEKTVSNVVNGYPHVSEETRIRVLAAVETLNYRANLSARNLARGRTGLIGLALPSLRNPYFAELAGLVIDAARDRSMTVLVDQTEGERDREQQVLNGLIPHLIDGLILSPESITSEEIEAKRDDVPVVLLGEKIFKGPVDHVCADNVAAAREATEHLIGLGRRRIGAIGLHRGPLTATAALRLRGYRHALIAARLPHPDALTRVVKRFERADGAEAMAALLAAPRPPDAVICFNDVVAIGALRALEAAGMRVPEDVSVVGFDDIEEARFSNPTLTTIAWDKKDIAETAVRLLDERINNRKQHPPREVETAFHLAVRASSGPKERARRKYARAPESPDGDGAQVGSRTGASHMRSS